MKDKILQFFSKLPEPEVMKLFMSYQIATLETMFPVVSPTPKATAAPKARRAKRSRRKTAAPTTTTTHIEDKTLTATAPSMAELIGKALTSTPMRPVEIANKLYQSKLIPALTAKTKQRVGMELIRLAKLGRIAKDGKAYRVV